MGMGGMGSHNGAVRVQGGMARNGSLLSPDFNDHMGELDVPDSAFVGANFKAMQSTDSGLPLKKNAVPPAGTGMPQGWDDFDEVEGALPVFNPSQTSGSIARSRGSGGGRKRKWRWPWQKEQERTGERVILLNNEAGNLAEGYCSNYVSTSKYNVATFLPKFLTGVFIFIFLTELSCSHALQNNSRNTPTYSSFSPHAFNKSPVSLQQTNTRPSSHSVSSY